MNHFYAISRTDLPLHQQAIQSAHAQLEFARLYPEVLAEEHPPFVWLSVFNQIDLLVLKSMLRSENVTVAEFHDPDYQGYNPSAIACLLPEEKRYLLSGLDLMQFHTVKRRKWFPW